MSVASDEDTLLLPKTKQATVKQQDRFPAAIALPAVEEPCTGVEARGGGVRTGRGNMVGVA